MSVIIIFHIWIESPGEAYLWSSIRVCWQSCTAFPCSQIGHMLKSTYTLFLDFTWHHRCQIKDDTLWRWQKKQSARPRIDPAQGLSAEVTNSIAHTLSLWPNNFLSCLDVYLWWMDLDSSLRAWKTQSVRGTVSLCSCSTCCFLCGKEPKTSAER